MLTLTPLIICGFALLALLILLIFAISYSSTQNTSREEASSYECGFEQNSLSRIPLSIRYFILTLVFLIFDIEIMLLIFTPLDLSYSASLSYTVAASLLFILTLIGGLVYEWYDGSLEWVI